jgi:hypothetical protein
MPAAQAPGQAKPKTTAPTPATRHATQAPFAARPATEVPQPAAMLAAQAPGQAKPKITAPTPATRPATRAPFAARPATEAPQPAAKPAAQAPTPAKPGTPLLPAPLTSGVLGNGQFASHTSVASVTCVAQSSSQAFTSAKNAHVKAGEHSIFLRALVPIPLPETVPFVHVLDRRHTSSPCPGPGCACQCTLSPFTHKQSSFGQCSSTALCSSTNVAKTKCVGTSSPQNCWKG